MYEFDYEKKMQQNVDNCRKLQGIIKILVFFPKTINYNASLNTTV